MINYFLNNLIKSRQHEFSNVEFKISDYFLSQGNELVNKTIKNIADETDISQTSIFNFVKNLGFEGFNDFKISLAQSINPVQNTDPLTAYSDIAATDTTLEIFNKILNFNIDAMQNLRSTIDYKRLENIGQLIQNARTLHFFGLGGSSIVAHDAYHKFMRTHYLCNYIGDHHMQLSYATKLNQDDCVFLFSHSGHTIETIRLAKVLRRTNAKVIVLTGNPGSELIDYCDEYLVIISAESTYRTESSTARILYLTLIDVLYTELMYKNEVDNQESMQRIRESLNLTKTEDEWH